MQITFHTFVWNKFQLVIGFLNKICDKISPLHIYKPKLQTADTFLVGFLTSVSFFIRMWHIQEPNYVVFDEVYFGNFTNWYIQKLYFQDIHPPLAKLIIAKIAAFSGYDGHYNFEAMSKNQTPYNTMDYVLLRMIPAMFGSCCIPLIYLILRLICTSRLPVIFGTFLVLFDPMLIVESRYILSDSILHFFSCLSIFTIFLFEHYPNILCFVFKKFVLTENDIIDFIHKKKYHSNYVLQEMVKGRDVRDERDELEKMEILKRIQNQNTNKKKSDEKHASPLP